MYLSLLNGKINIELVKQILFGIDWGFGIYSISIFCFRITYYTFDRENIRENTKRIKQLANDLDDYN